MAGGGEVGTAKSSARSCANFGLTQSVVLFVCAPGWGIKIFQFDFNKNEQQLRPIQFWGRTGNGCVSESLSTLTPGSSQQNPFTCHPLLQHPAIMPKLQTCYLIYGVSCVYFWFPAVIFSRLPSEMPCPHFLRSFAPPSSPPPLPASPTGQQVRVHAFCESF